MKGAPDTSHRDKWYAALKAYDVDRLRRCSEIASAKQHNFNLTLSQAAELEWSLVSLSCELLGVSP